MAELTSRAAVLSLMSEEEYLQEILSWARRGGWLAYHTRDSRRSVAGFPDLIMLRGPEALAIEVKSRDGQLSEAQAMWLDALREAGIESLVARPEAGDAIRAFLLDGAPVRDGFIRASMASLVTQSMRPPTRKRRGPQRVSRKGLSPRVAPPRLSE